VFKPLTIALTLAGLAAVAPCRADEPTESPETFEPDVYPRPAARLNVLLGGAALGAGSYGIAVGTSYLWSDAPTAGDLRVPVVGPWMAVAGAKCGSAESGCGTFTVVVRTFLATLSGLGQLGAVGVLAEGVFMKTQSEPEVRSKSPEQTSVYVSPMADDTALGFAVGGQF
jgi:hypothetical protein